MKHYICTGTCHGESNTPGVCQTEGCNKFHQPLSECACQDGSHRGIKGAHVHADSESSDNPRESSEK